MDFEYGLQWVALLGCSFGWELYMEHGVLVGAGSDSLFFPSFSPLDWLRTKAYSFPSLFNILPLPSLTCVDLEAAIAPSSGRRLQGRESFFRAKDTIRTRRTLHSGFFRSNQWFNWTGWGPGTGPLVDRPVDVSRTKEFGGLLWSLSYISVFSSGH